MFNALVVEDDKNTRRLMVQILKNNGFAVFDADNGVSALAVLENEHVDIIVLDVMMPVMDGYEFTKRLREADVTIPILMISAKQEVADKKAGLKLGIDDYMVKPFDEEEMILRIKALMRRSQIVSSKRLIIGDVLLNYDALTVSRDGVEQMLPKKEFFLLFKLLSSPNTIFTRYQIMDELWGMDSNSDERTINVHINRLRDRFGDYPEFEIVTVRGLGYKAICNDTPRGK
ncbi:MAG: response regulator transcription factor [Christensenellaceae bacterium]|jgi:DNA-binding response OmpR family regulator|nr:response regulator transcription factor [Christensenellaceae bacterium]